jgi:uncharacterized repeat protein (TIGR01451 family)
MARSAARCGVLLAVFMAVVGLPSDAVADRAFGPRFTVNTQGNITIAANSIESCLDSLPACANVRNAVGGAIPGNNNNQRAMTWLDADTDPATFDSSSSALSLPGGASVLFAGLYYGGRLAAGQGGSPPPNPSARNTVLFKAPGDTSYRSLTASQVDEASTQYQGFVNVTGIVDAAGPGTYWAANVQLGTGLSDSSSGGWALVVAYGDPAAPSRNLSVFDGLQNVSSSGTVTIPLSGFQTPRSGPVTSTVGIVAYEGDLGTTGDGAQIQGASGFTALSNAVNPGPPATSASNSNVFNSTISNAGAFVTSRFPSYQNNLGYDADLFSTTDVLGHEQTSTQVRLSTSGDAYQPGVVTIATDLYAPRITATKTVDQPTASLGDTLTYTMAVQNTGPDLTLLDDAVGTTLSDLIPPGTVFVPGSIRVNGAVVTDAPGDDLGELAGGQVVARLGTGATATAGGRLGPGASATVSFQVRVATAGFALGATIVNTADISFTADTTDVPSTVTTAPAITNVNVPDLAIGKEHIPPLSPGLSNMYTITVRNVGAGPTSGEVTVTDTIEPPGLTINGPVTGAGWSCSTLGTTVTCTRPDALPPGSDYPSISIPVLVSGSAQPGQLSNTATLQASSDGNADNNSFTDSGALSEPAIDLHVEKVVTSTPNFTPVGYLHFLDPITYRIEVTNNGVADAANVQLAETFDAPLILDSITTSPPGSCSGTVCNLGTIAPGQAPVTIDVQLSIANSFDTYPSAALLNNTATVSAPVGTEINPDDNSASAAISTVPWAETSITKTFAPAQPVAGGPVTYTLTVHSDGPGTVDMVVADILPEALQKPPTSISISGGTGVCQYDPTRENSGFPPGSPIVFCEIPQLGPGEDRVITIEGTLARDSAGTQVDNLALSSNTLPITGVFSFEPDLTNNDDLVSFTPGTVDVGMTKSVVGSSTIAVGDVATFRLRASSSGTVAATGVAVTDTLPDGLTLVGAPPACTANGQTVTCAVGTLAPGAEATFDLQVRAELAAAGKTLTNGARVSTADPDLASADNTASANLTVGPAPAPREVDVAVTVRGPTARVREGGIAAFRVNVTNRGPNTATSVVLTGTAERALSDSVAGLLQSNCTRLPLRCEVGTLAPGQQRSFTVRVRRLLLGRLTVTGSVTAAEAETTLANNIDRASIRIRAGRAVVRLTKRAGTASARIGDAVGFTIAVRNMGSVPARSVVVCDRLASGLTWERLGGARLAGGRACWTLRRLEGGSTARYRISTRAVSVARVRPVTNTAIVQGANLARRTAAARVTLRPAGRQKPPFTG